MVRMCYINFKPHKRKLLRPVITKTLLFHLNRSKHSGAPAEEIAPQQSPISPAAQTVLIFNNQLRQKDTYLK